MGLLNLTWLLTALKDSGDCTLFNVEVGKTFFD
jgi:hypothetical protein